MASKTNIAVKEKLVAELQGKFSRAGAAFIAEYQGMKAVDMSEIRKLLRDASIEFKIVRNTLARRAIKGLPAEVISKDLKGPVALIFSYKDAALAAKKLTEFAKEKPTLKIMLGALGGKVISLSDIKGLAELPSREVLIARLLGSMQSPATGLVIVLGGVQRKFLYALNAIKDKKAAGQGA